jgi:hypothetical protein
MPADRLFHKRACRGERIVALDHFEFRVWWQYVMSADDFGVLPKSPLSIKADNPALATASDTRVKNALIKLVNCGLLGRFEHQGRRYLYQRDWQSYQRVRYPRETEYPKPPADFMADCDEATRALFAIHPGGGKTPKDSRSDAETLPEDSRKISEIVPQDFGVTRAPACGQARMATSMAIATANGCTDSLEARFENFWAAYPKKVGKDDARRSFAKRKPSQALLDSMLEAIELQRVSPQWSRDGGQFIPNPATWLNQGRWQDEVAPADASLSDLDLREAAETFRRSYGGRCMHEGSPHKGSTECIQQIAIDRRLKRSA